MIRALERIDRLLERADRALVSGPRWPLVLFVLALVLKAVYLLLSADALHVRVPIMDARYYDQTAQDLARRHLAPGGAFFMAPLYPYLLALVYSVVGREFMLVRLLQAVGGAATVALTFVLGRRVFRPSAALAGTLILILYGATTFYEGELLAEWLVTLLNVAALLALHPRTAPSARSYAAAGALLGLSVLARAGMLVFAVCVLVWILRGERRQRRIAYASAFVLPLLVVSMPAVIQNHAAGGGFLPVTSNMGVNFYIGNGSAADGMFAPIRDVDVIDDPTTRDFIGRQAGEEPGPRQVDAYWFARALDDVRASPARPLFLLARKAALFFNGYEAPQLESFDVQRRQSGWLRALFVPLWFIMAFGLLGLLSSLREWRRYGLLVQFVLAAAASIVVFFVAGRYRVPVIPVLCLFAGHAVTAIPVSLRSFRRAAAMAVPAFALLLATNPGIFAIDPGVVQFQEQLRRARRLSELRSFEPALREVNRAIAVFPKEPAGYLERAVVYRASGNDFKAIEDYNRVLEMDASQPSVHYDLAQALRRVNLRDAAIREYELAAEYDPKMAQAYNNLGVTCRELKRYEPAIAAFRKAIEVAPGYRPAYNNLGAAYAETDRLDEAIATFTETTRRFPDYPNGFKNLAMAYAAKKQPRPALDAMKKYVSLNPLDVEAGELIRKLEIAVRADSGSARD